MKGKKMPPQAGKSNAFNKLKNDQKVKQAFNKHKGDETKLSGGGDLPPGINFGVAKLVDARIADHADGEHKGKPYLYFAGIVTEPAKYAGMRTNKIVRLYDYKTKTQDDNIATALNEMRKMGIDTKGLELNDWEAALEGLKQEEPHFRFRTWVGQPTAQYPNPITNTDYNGVINDYTPGEGGAGEMEVADDNETGGDGDEENSNVSSDNDWADMGAQADAGDEEVAATLQAALEERGLNPDDYPSWAEAATAIADYDGSGSDGGDEGGETESEEEATPWKPAVKDVYEYKDKGARKKEEYEVTKVYGKKLDMKRLSDNKKLAGLVWSNDPDAINGQEI